MKKNQTTRDSNFELLRIVAMAFIVLHHMIVHGTQMWRFSLGEPSIFPVGNIPVAASLVLLNAFFVVGVNSFLLISGFYGIKLKFKSFYALLITCLLYSYAYDVLVAYTHHTAYVFSLQPLEEVFLHSGWFITCYVGLMFLSPFINKAVVAFTSKEAIYGLILLSVLTFWFGFHLGSTYINETGYNVLHFVFIYYMGQLLRRFESSIRIKSSVSWGVYVGVSLVIGLIAFRQFYVGNFANMFKQFQYNNPLLVLSSVALFLAFKQLAFKARFINWFAGSVLAIYLVHDHFFFREWFVRINQTYGILTPQTVGIALLIVVVLMFGVVLLDKLRLIVTNPIVDFLSNKSEQIQNRIESKLSQKKSV